MSEGEIVRDNMEMTEAESGGVANGILSRRGDRVRVTVKRVEIMLDQISNYDSSNHKIAKVPDFLRRENAKAYDPTIVSIGPIHHDKIHVKDMEKHKVWYLNQLLQRIKEHSLEEYMIALEELEEKARDYYSSLIQLPGKDAFLTMLLLDGVFVIELVRKWSFRFSGMIDDKDYIFQYSKVNSSNAVYNKDHCNEALIQIRRDMLMIENQLPFFILTKLFEMTKIESSDNNLCLLVLKFFCRIIPGRPEVLPRTENYNGVHDHLLGLVYKAYFVDETIYQTHNHEDFKYHEINSTSELHEAGITFKRAETTTLMNVKFEKGVTKIPKLEVGDVTESLFRNLIAYELIRFYEKRTPGDDNTDDDQHNPRYVTEYCFLMQFLVNSKKDVEILRRAGIVTNWMGDDEMVRLFFNKLTKNVSSSQEFYYANIICSMNEYCKQRCNFKKWWTIVSVLVAILLILATPAILSFLT